MLQLTRNQQKAFLLECLCNIKRLYADYIVDGLQEVDIIKDGHVNLIIPNDRQDPVAIKLRALISIYNKVAQINFDLTQYKKSPVAKVSIAEEAVSIFSLMKLEAVPRDQLLMNFLIQFNYSSWLATDNKRDSSFIETNLAIRKRMALDDVMQLLKSGEFLNETFSSPGWLNPKLIKYKEKNNISYLQAIYQYQRNLFYETAPHRCIDILEKVFGTNNKDIKALTRQEKLILGTVIQYLEFNLTHDAKTLDNEFLATEEYRHSINPITKGHALSEDDLKNHIKPLLNAITDREKSAKPETVVVQAPESAANEEFERIDLTPKQSKCNTPYVYGYYAYIPSPITIHEEESNGLTVADVVKQTAESCFLHATDRDIFQLQWPDHVTLEIKPTALDERYLKVMCHNAVIPIQFVTEDGSIQRVGQITGSMELSYEVTKNDDNTYNYELVQVWSDESRVSEIWDGNGLSSVNIVTYYLDSCIKTANQRKINKDIQENSTYQDVERRQEAVQRKRDKDLLDEKAERLFDLLKKNTIDNSISAKENYANLMQSTRKLAQLRMPASVKSDFNHFITELETLYAPYSDEEEMVSKLNNALQAVNRMMICKVFATSLKDKHDGFNHEFVSAAQDVVTQMDNLRTEAKSQRLRTAMFILISSVIIAASIVTAVFTAGLSLGLIATPIILASAGVGFFGGFAGEVVGIRKAVNSHGFFKMSNSMCQLKSKVIPENIEQVDAVIQPSISVSHTSANR